MTNKEIEIRVKVKDSKPLLQFLEQNGAFKSEKYQKDEYFTPAHKNFLEVKPIKEWLRLREEEGKYSLNYKNWQYADDGKAYHCDEYEVGLGDVEKTRLIFEALDFKPLIIVDKKRKTFNYKDYEIAMDSVVDLGDYVEVEYKGTDDVDSKVISEQMLEFLKQAGCEVIEQNFTGYPFLLLEKKYGVL